MERYLSNGVIRRFTWDADNIIADIDENGLSHAKYTYEPSQYGMLISALFANNSGFNNGSRYYHYDALGSTRLITLTTLSTDSYTYRAFGQTTSGGFGAPQPFRWVGQLGYLTDPLGTPNTLPVLVRARYYDVRSARWVSRDPIGFGGGDANVYRYASGNAVSQLDPGGFSSTHGPWTRDLPYNICVAWAIGFSGLVGGFYKIEEYLDYTLFVTYSCNNGSPSLDGFTHRVVVDRTIAYHWLGWISRTTPKSVSPQVTKVEVTPCGPGFEGSKMIITFKPNFIVAGVPRPCKDIRFTISCCCSDDDDDEDPSPLPDPSCEIDPWTGECVPRKRGCSQSPIDWSGGVCEG